MATQLASRLLAGFGWHSPGVPCGATTHFRTRPTAATICLNIAKLIRHH
jgi:hypothetical protein